MIDVFADEFVALLLDERAQLEALILFGLPSVAGGNAQVDHSALFLVRCRGSGHGSKRRVGK